MTEVPMRFASPSPSGPAPVRVSVALLILAVLVSALTGAASAAVMVAGLAGSTAAPLISPVPSLPVVLERNVGPEAVPDLVREVLPGVVTVINKVNGRAQSSGSGYVVDAQRGYIITNSHVVSNTRGTAAGDSFDVVFSDERTVAATLVGRDPQTDVAVLRVPAQGLTALRLANSDEIPVGAQVVAIGSALGELRNSVTSGVVSAKGRRAQSSIRADVLLEDLIQTDAAISPGNSGGPLIWVATRRVVAMNTLVNREPGAEGLGFSVSANTVKQISDEIIRSGSVERGFVGINYRELSAQLAQTLRLPPQTRGIVITQVLAGSPGAAAGLRPNDVLTKVDGQAIDGDHPLATILLRYRANDRVRVTLIRDGVEQSVEVTLGRQPQP